MLLFFSIYLLLQRNKYLCLVVIFLIMDLKKVAIYGALTLAGLSARIDISI
jgi:hypothetical protein